MLHELRQRGVTQIAFIVTDGHAGLLAAVAALFPATAPHRCVVPTQRKVMNAIAQRERGPMATELAGIWKAATTAEALIHLAAFQGNYQKCYPEAVRSLLEEKEQLLTFYDFPPVMHRYLRTTHALESFVSKVRQRTDQLDTLTTETSCLTMVWAVMQGIHVPRIPVS